MVINVGVGVSGHSVLGEVSKPEYLWILLQVTATKMKSVAFFVSCFLLTVSVAHAVCPSEKMNRKSQERRLGQLESGHVVALVNPLSTTSAGGR